MTAQNIPFKTIPFLLKVHEEALENFRSAQATGDAVKMAAEWSMVRVIVNEIDEQLTAAKILTEAAAQETN